MKKRYLTFLGTLLLLVAFVTQAGARDIENYKYDFNTAYGAFYSSYYTYYEDPKAAPIGWGHLADGVASSYTSTYPEYYFRENDGVDGSGCLRVGSQRIQDDDYRTRTVYDLLVTPAVTGKMSLQAKLWYSGGSVRFFKVTYENGEWKRGSEIVPTVNPELSDKEYQTIEIDGLQGEYVGIRASEAYIDDFAADKVTMEDRTSLAISNVTSNMPARNNCNEDGTYKLSYTVYVNNSGTTDLAPGAYSVSIANPDTTVIATVAGAKTLKPGDNDTLTIEHTINYSDYPSTNGYTFLIKENVSNSVARASTVTLVPFQPTCNFKSTSYPYAPIDTLWFDYAQKPVSQPFRLENAGGSTLRIQRVDLPAGFTMAAIDSVAPGSTVDVSVTMNDSIVGPRDVKLVFHTNAGEKSLTLNGYVVDKGVWFTNFGYGYSDSGIPVNMRAGGSWKNGYLDVVNNTYRATADTTRSRLITPKLHFDQGGTLTFQSGRTSEAAPELVVSYAATRDASAAWTKLDSITSFSEDRYAENTNLYKMTSHTVSIPAGDWYIAFDGKNVGLDNIYGGVVVPVAHDIEIAASEIPATATVNHAANAKVSIRNANTKDEKAADYTVALYAGGQKLAEAASADVASARTATFSFTFTPHAVGTQPVYAKLVWADGYTVTTDTTQLAIAQETAGRTQQLGTPTTNGGNRGPVRDYYRNCETVSYFTADEIGLAKGTKIRKITYRGHSTSAHSGLGITVRLKNVEGGVTYPTGKEASDTTGTTAYSVTQFTLPAGGSTSALPYDASNSIDLITVDLSANPFVYDGGGLEIFTCQTSTETYFSNFGFEVDGSSQEFRIRYADNELADADWKAEGSRPVVTIDVDAEPSVLTGTVKDEDGQAIANQTVTLTSDDVVYTGTTNEQGQYSVTVYQDTKTYTLTTSKTGYTPVKQTVKLEGNTVKDIVLKKATGFFFAETSIPATATTNNAYTATVDAQNIITTSIAAADYTATLYFNGEAVATAATQNVASYDTAKLSFQFYPHATGTFPAYVKIVKGAYEYVTDTVQVTVSPEFVEGEVVVGNNNSTANDVIAKNYYRYTTTHIIYPKAAINLPKGAKITGVSFKGTSSKSDDYPCIIYMENTTEDFSNGFTDIDLDTKTPVFDGSVKANDVSATFSEPFVYTGDNVRVVVLLTAPDGYPNTTFQVDENYKDNTYVRYSDSGQPEITTDNAANYDINHMPVMYLTVDNSKKYTATVTDVTTQAPVANATVTLTSEDGHAVYSGTTDSEGNVTILVAQHTKTYNVSVAATGYIAATGTLSFGDDNAKTATFALAADPSTGINSIATDKADGNTVIYDLSGRYVGQLKDKASLPKGVYIVGGKKVVIK